jgi:glycosyltransferase involved in cell wall biosynthesis
VHTAIEMASHFDDARNYSATFANWKLALNSLSPSAHNYWCCLIETLYAATSPSNADGSSACDEQSYYRDKFQELTTFVATADKSDVDACKMKRSIKMKAIEVLRREGALDVIQAFVSRFQILAGDVELANQVMRDCFGADLDGSHSWMEDTDIAAERVALITTVIIPFAKRHLPSSELFVALKELEAIAIASGDAIPDFDQIFLRIEAVKNGTWAPDICCATVLSERTNKRLIFPDPLFRIVLSVACNSPTLLFDLRARYGKEDMRQILRKLGKLVPVYLVCTNHGYPLGGGESFMHQTCKIMHEFGFACIWTSFTGSDLRSYRRSSTARTPYYLDVRQVGGMTREQIYTAIRRWSPDVIHSQASANEYVAEASFQLRIPALRGYHFWDGLIKLGPMRNRRIIRNARRHQLAAIPKAMQSKLVTRYVASEFMAEVYKKLGGKAPIEIYHPIPDPAHYETSRTNSGDHVLQINIAEGKGGKILLECVRKLGLKIPFLVVRTEPLSEGLDEKIKDAIKNSPGSVYAEYGSVKNYYAQARLVIIPTLVDETFCRVAFEAIMNGIPVLCTRNGFLPYMLGDTGVYLPEDPGSWSNAMETLYADLDRLRQIAEAQKTRLQKLFGRIPEAFINGAFKALVGSPKRNIGFFTAWAEQGLGHQVRQYAKLFRRAGYRTHVFSFQPYSAADKALVFQYNPNDWSTPEHADSVYYSFNDRESVTSRELEQFIKANNVGALVCPEVCWEPNWTRLKSLSVDNLAICSVPNIETVRKSEVIQHSTLHATWYNTKLSETILYRLGVRNGTYIGHAFGCALNEAFLKRKVQRLRTRDYIAFVHVGGHNPVLRKQTHLVIEAFSRALQYRNDIHLTVAVMNSLFELRDDAIAPNITVINETLSHDEILDLYEQNDVSIQVSSHEGLGLGFYESISRGTPIISLNASPHNEVVLHGQTGWLLNATEQPVPDNNDAVITAAKFDVGDLAEMLTRFLRDDLEHMIESTCRVFSERFDELSFLIRLLGAMPENVLARWLAGTYEAPLRCLLCEQGAVARMARVVARAVWPNQKPSWAGPAAPMARMVGRIDRWVLRLRLLVIRPSCCSEAARRGHPCIGRMGQLASASARGR